MALLFCASREVIFPAVLFVACRALHRHTQVQAANAMARDRGLAHSHAHFVVGDALQPDLPDGCFDLVVSVESAAYMPDKE